MCQTAITLISKALVVVDSTDLLLKIKGIIALFIQTMAVSSLSRLLQAQNKSLNEVLFRAGITLFNHWMLFC